MATWYEVNNYNERIDPVEVVKETAQTVTVVHEWNGRKSEHRAMKTATYYPTREEAVAVVRARLERSIVGLEEELKNKKERLANFLLAQKDFAVKE
jgi:hypothetical protein